MNFHDFAVRDHSLWTIVDEWNRYYKTNKTSLFLQDDPFHQQSSLKQQEPKLEKRTKTFYQMSNDDEKPIYKIMNFDQARRFERTVHNTNPIDFSSSLLI